MNSILNKIFEENEFIEDDLFEYSDDYFREPKNNPKSLALRNEGSKCFSKKKYINALRLYNESICFATENSEELSIAYANRSAVYFELKEYELCMQNIELARQTTAYPERLFEKLNRRETKCKDILNCKWGIAKSSRSLKPRLSYTTHKTVPFIVNSLEIKQDDTFGRYVITNKDLNVGDIIAIDEPFAFIVPKSKQFERCEHCYIENTMSLIPCRWCTAVMFCSQTCFEDAYQQYHKYECPIIDYLNNQVRVRFCLLPLRITLYLLSTFTSMNDLVEFINELDGNDNNIFNINYIPAYNRMVRYASVFSLQEGRSTGSREREVQLLFALLAVLIKKTDLHEHLTSSMISLLMDLQRRHLLISTINSSANLDLTDENSDNMIGIYPFRSLLNHACSANVMSTSYGKNVIISVLRPIFAGEQLFDSYGCNHRSHSIEQRNAQLEFDCACVACEKEYPLEHELWEAQIPQPLSKKNIQAITKTFDPVTASSCFKDVIKYMNTNDLFYPCLQLSIAQDVYQYMVDIIYSIEIPLMVKIKQPLDIDDRQVYTSGPIKTADIEAFIPNISPNCINNVSVAKSQLPQNDTSNI